MENRIDLAIIGGGLFGTSALHFAQQRNIHVELFEANHQLGGKIQSKNSHISRTFSFLLLLWIYLRADHIFAFLDYSKKSM